MAQSIVLRGADIELYIGGQKYKVAQSITYTINYNEQEIYGVDSVFPQEISSTKVTVQGSVSGVRVKSSGGLQGYGVRPRIQDVLNAPYLSFRIKDRHTDKDILWIPQVKVSSEQMQVAIKGVASLSFTFKGIIPYNELDLA